MSSSKSNVNVIILAGGLGTRLVEETDKRPKPMVEINGQPILLHLMRIFQDQISCRFVVATGYKSEIIDSYLKSREFKENNFEATALYTGENTMTGGRVRQAMRYLGHEQSIVTYGDGLGNVNISSLLQFHAKHRKYATVTAVRPAARFGRLEIKRSRVTKFSEKNQSQEGWINGGFFVFEPEVTSFISSDEQALEIEPMAQLAEIGQLMAFKHYGFWQPMDTLREKQELERLLLNGNAPWLTH